MRFRSVYKVLLAILGGCVGCFYFAFIDRAHATFDKDDWHLELSYVRMACRTCSGRVEKLRYRGQMVGVPKHWNSKKVPTYIEFATPVAILKWFPDVSSWRFEHTGIRDATDNADQILNEELAAGYYELEPTPVTTQPYVIPKKKGTPKSWILTITSDYDYYRWCDPSVIEKIAW